MLSFRFFKSLMILLLKAAVSAAFAAPIAEGIVAATDLQGPSLDQHVRQLLAGGGIDLLDCGPGNTHEGPAGFLR